MHYRKKPNGDGKCLRMPTDFDEIAQNFTPGAGSAAIRPFRLFPQRRDLARIKSLEIAQIR
jgi:hypothetical protein